MVFPRPHSRASCSNHLFGRECPGLLKGGWTRSYVHSKENIPALSIKDIMLFQRTIIPPDHDLNTLKPEIHLKSINFS
jgi:hypothetical protein